MEIIIGAAVIIMLLLFAGVDIWFIFLGFMFLVAAAAVITAGFFAVCAVTILSGKRRAARFVRFEKGGRFDAAIYSADGEEYANAFPAEFILRDRLYSSDRTVTIRTTKRGRAFDKNALLSTAAGLPLSILTAVIFGGGAMWFSGLL